MKIISDIDPVLISGNPFDPFFLNRAIINSLLYLQVPLQKWLLDKLF